MCSLAEKIIDSFPSSSTILTVFCVPDTVIPVSWRLVLSIREKREGERLAKNQFAAPVLITKQKSLKMKVLQYSCGQMYLF